MTHTEAAQQVTRRLHRLFCIVGLGAAIAACGGGGGSSGPAEPPAMPPAEPPTFKGLQNFHDAESVVGQPGFLTSATNAGQPLVNASGLNNPFGVAVSEGGMLFIADSENNRLLAFRSVPQTPGQAADFVIDTGLLSPRGISIGQGKLAVADGANHRVLIFDPVPTSGTATPSVVIGQQGPDARDQTCNNATLSVPSAVQITTGGKLMVADAGHSRVLVWNSIPAAGQHGAPANIVLGQPDFDNCLPNAGGADVPGRGTMRHPQALWSDGVRVAVADSVNRRVLLWNGLTSAPVGQLPDTVLGQPGFDQVGQFTPDADVVRSPAGISFNGTHLAVSDNGNNRVLLWGGWPSRHMQAATTVVGQRLFTHGAANDSNGDGTGDDAPSEKTLDGPLAVTFHQDRLLAVDSSNNRVLIYKSN